MIGINQSNLCQLESKDLYRVCEDIANFGFESVRFAVDWGSLSNFFGATNYRPVIDVAKALKEFGLDPMPCLGIHYPWLHSPSAFGNFVGKCTDIFGNVPYYEVWNEPNLMAFSIGGPSNYVKYLKSASPRIRSVGSKVISAGLAACPNWSSFLGRNYAPVDWLNGMYSAGEKGDYDLLGCHPYPMLADANGTFSDPNTIPFGIRQISDIRSEMIGRNDSRQLAFTEVGYPTNLVSIPNACKWMEIQLREMIASNDLAWIFTWRDTQGDGGNYGLLDRNNKPKGAYHDTVKNILSK